MKNITLITLFVGASAFITSAYAEISGNLGVTSNYLWRGLSQNGTEASVSGGLDYSGDGFYAGFWTANLSGDQEVDLYVGTELNGFDVGLIKYCFDASEATEYYVGYSIGGFDLSYAADVDDSDLSYTAVSYGFTITEGLDATLTYGDYDAGLTDTGAIAYGEYIQLDVAYGDLTITVADRDADTEVDYAVSYGWGF